MKKMIRSCLSLVKGGLVSCPRVARQPSLYPQLSRKSFGRRYLDCCYLRLRDGWLFEQYNGTLCDLKGHSVKDVVTEAMIYQKMVPIARKRGAQYGMILDDKYLFSRFFDKMAVPVIAHIHYGKCYLQGKLISAEELKTFLLSLSQFFVKAPMLNCGRGCDKVKVVSDAFVLSGGGWQFEAAVKDTQYLIFQAVIENHADIKKLNPTTLNTLRVATCWKDGKVELFDDPILRTGRLTGSVDNYHQGGVCFGIDKDGCGYETAINQIKGKYALYTEHPDSHIHFKGYKLPLYAEAIALALKAQEMLPSIPSVGWDVAITPDGPFLLEGNLDWDICLLQEGLGRPLMKRYHEVYDNL